MPKIKMSLEQYIRNPAGWGSATNATPKPNVDEIYMNKLSILERQKQIELVCTSSNDKKKYYVYTKLPSESNPGFFYDVVIEFDKPSKNNDDGKFNDNDLSKYNVKFFSNDFNFVYTYAYAFKEHGLTIPELELKLPFRSLTTKANVRNPGNTIGWVKSFYIVYLLMQRKNLLSKANFEMVCRGTFQNEIVNKIPLWLKKEAQYETYKRDKGSTNKSDRHASKIIKSKALSGLITEPIMKLTKFTRKTTSINKSSNRVKNTKKTKRI